MVNDASFVLAKHEAATATKQAWNQPTRFLTLDCQATIRNGIECEVSRFVGC